mgnify:CR=1 FL=1
MREVEPEILSPEDFTTLQSLISKELRNKVDADLLGIALEMEEIYFPLEMLFV